jgi:hypothetical protein
MVVDLEDIMPTCAGVVARLRKEFIMEHWSGVEAIQAIRRLTLLANMTYLEDGIRSTGQILLSCHSDLKENGKGLRTSQLRRRSCPSRLSQITFFV